ncbi:hypothetical protein amb1742 [Paramagnetospirillum magneticum AMB-1]|uniref:Uncharacterized protein n=1 Tax=Paramagnetospirillum magneticum (strain ATCC 700264 / AMB-1) TaxID=342108 RepID=Q2W6H9_PARM1|nr:hypothetical protein amb1742 [Paramagnetospirillum magneticum AMB-1]
MTDGMPKVLQQIVAERCAQDVQWGGPEHDDGHDADDWRQLLRRHIDRLADPYDSAAPAADYRDRLIKIAAIAVASATAWDRAMANAEANLRPESTKES